MSVVKNIHTDVDLHGNELKRFRFESLTSDPDPIDGGVYYNTTIHQFVFCLNGVWTPLSDMLSIGWTFDEQGNLVTDSQVVIKNNAIIEGDTGSGGDGEDVPVGLDEAQLKEYLDSNKYVTEDDIEELIPEVDLSDYYTTTQVDDLFSKKVNASDVYTKKELADYKSWWDKLMAHITVDENGNVVIDPNLMVVGDVASGDDGEDVVIGGVQAISVNGGNPIYPNEQGIIELNDIGGGVSEGDVLNILEKNAYATKSWVNEQGFAKASALSSYQPLATAINTGNIANQKVAGLAKAVSIWGQSFDGTGDVSGDLKLGYAKLTFGTDGSIYHIGWNSSTNMFSYKSYYGHYFSTDGEERLRISQSGNVLIGTSTDTGYRLEVCGKAKFYGNDNTYKLYTRINESGVQVGRTKAAYTGGFNCGLSIGEDDSPLGFIAGAYNGDVGSASVKFFYGGTSQANASIVINGLSGNVGIGTASPLYKLDVTGTIQSKHATNPYLKLTNNSYSTYVQLLSSGDLVIGKSSALGLHVTQSGAVTMPSTLSVKSISITDTTVAAHLAFGRDSANYITAPASGFFSFVTNGKVCSSATSDLQIRDGEVNINGNLIVKGDVASA